MGQSHYISMRDGARLAVNVHLPTAGRERGSRLPTVLHQTRYMRSIEWRRPIADRGLERFLDTVGTTRELFLAAGYAWVDVDVRGSGASFGYRPSPWWRDEVADGGQIVDWIVSQPWSSGRVGSTGVSYSGTCAEMLLCNQHPAVRAVIPRFSLYDVYADVAFPGGIHLSWFTGNWSRFNRDLDRNEYHQALAKVVAHNSMAFAELARHRGRRRRARLLELAASERVASRIARVLERVTRGVSPVAGHEHTLAEAVEQRENFDVHEGALAMTHRDDQVSPDHPEATIDWFSPHHHRSVMEATGAHVLGVSGWLDGAYCNAATKRFALGDSERQWLVLGPWEHGGRQQISPHSSLRKAAFNHDADMLAFFDATVKHERTPTMPRVRYYTMGQERWKTASRWPPESVAIERFYMSEGGRLKESAPAGEQTFRYRVDGSLGTGRRSRWRTLLGMAAPPGYGHLEHAAERSLVFTGEVLSSDLVVTGNPLACLELSASEPDGGVFVYLEEVGPGGRVTYVTEGMLRLLHRAESDDGPWDPAGVKRSFLSRDAAPLAVGERALVRIPLLPVSHCFRAGSALRVRITGGDADHFTPIFSDGAAFTVHDGSRIELPVEQR